MSFVRKINKGPSFSVGTPSSAFLRLLSKSSLRNFSIYDEGKNFSSSLFSNGYSSSYFVPVPRPDFFKKIEALKEKDPHTFNALRNFCENDRNRHPIFGESLLKKLKDAGLDNLSSLEMDRIANLPPETCLKPSL